MKYQVIVADPPWKFGDKLTMSKTPRGSEANYPVLTTAALCGLNVPAIVADNATLALWCPSAMFTDGYAVVSAWGFEPKAIYTWVKLTGGAAVATDPESGDLLGLTEGGVAFGMGRYFRGCTEHAIIATRGSHMPVNRSQRGCDLWPALPHSEKPPCLQDKLDLMYPDANRLEMFARRSREGWVTVGDETPGHEGEDIRDWLPA